LGALIGSIAAGHSLAACILGGELLAAGVSLIAVTALIICWTTVGVAQLPAEALLLGRNFALYRSLLCFCRPSSSLGWRWVRCGWWVE
jgi:hypothetical protein